MSTLRKRSHAPQRARRSPAAGSPRRPSGPAAITPGTATTGAQSLVRTLESHGVTHVFGIPGAKIDQVFDTLVDSNIQTVVCRHEQNAAFIAAGLGRLTGRAGVALVTSGPGCSNLVTGLATATSEGDPVVAIGGAFASSRRLKQVHQAMDTVNLFRPITKYCAEIDAPDSVSEVIANAFRAAESGRPGAAFVSAPEDIMSARGEFETLPPAPRERLGPADAAAITEAAELIRRAKRPVLLLGQLSTEPQSAEAVRGLLARTRIPVVCTYQGAGVVPRELFGCFGGRVGLFRAQLADRLLDDADLVVAVGYYPIEFEPSLWNHRRQRNLIHVDCAAPSVDRDYRPQVELVGNIAATIRALTARVEIKNRAADSPLLAEIVAERNAFTAEARARGGMPVHPMRLVAELQNLIRDDITVCLDMGSFHIWLARRLYSFRPRQLLITNGQQTLGVGLPWAIAACLARPGEKALSISGDGGFLFSVMELETAVRLKCDLVHLVWIDGAYDMVRFQQVAKYGRSAGVEFGPVDIVQLAQSFGATGFMIDSPDQITPVLTRAMALRGPVVVGVPVDYRDNPQLMEMVHADALD